MKNILSTIIAAVPAVMLFGLSSSCTSSVEEPQIQKPAAAGEISGLTEVFEGGYIELTIPEIERAETYKWYKDGAVVRNDASRTLTVTEAGTYKVAGENEGGEGEASPDHIVTWGEILEPPADAGVIEGDTEFIEGESVTLSIAEIERAQMYKWYKDGEPMEGKTERTVTITDGGTYTVAGVNSAGEGKQSPEHTVIIHHFPADAGEISGGEAIEGLYILRVNTIEYADSYRWYCDGEFYRDDPDTTIMIMADEPGSYTVAGVNEYGEGRQSKPFIIGEPEPAPDPIPGLNQFAYDGVIYHIDPTSFSVNELGTYGEYLEIMLLDGTAGREGTHNRIIIWQFGREALDGRTIDVMNAASPWGLQYYATWEDFNQQPRFPTIDGGEFLKDGTVSAKLDEQTGTITIVADMVYEGYGKDVHFRCNFCGPLNGILDEETEPAQITSVDEITGGWYVTEYSANFDNMVVSPVNYSVEIHKIDESTVEISGMNGMSGAEQHSIRATLNSNGELEFGAHPEIIPSWNPEATTHLLPVPTDFDMADGSFADLWDMPFPAQKFSRGVNSGTLKLVWEIGDNDFTGTGLHADYIVAARQLGTDYEDYPAWFHTVICGTVWTKASIDIPERASSFMMPEHITYFDTERPVEKNTFIITEK